MKWQKIGVERHGKRGLKAVYVIENDTTEYEDDFVYDKDTFYSGWAYVANIGESREHAQYSSKKIDYFAETPACELPIRFTINGETITTAYPTSHEECSQLAKRLKVESTFLYSQLKRHRDNLNRKNEDGKIL